MALENDWQQIPPVLITRDSPVSGGVAIDRAYGFRVAMLVTIKGNTLPNLNCQVKRVENGIVYVGHIGPQFKDFIDVSAYTVALGSTIEATEQIKQVLPEDDQDNDRYERGPVNADRVVLVDTDGDLYDDKNPIPVEDVVISINKPTITNVAAPFANTEVSLTIPKTARKFFVQVRNGLAKAQISYVMNNSGSEFITVQYGCYYEEKNLNLDSDLYLYIQTNMPNQTLELLVWE